MKREHTNIDGGFSNVQNKKLARLVPEEETQFLFLMLPVELLWMILHSISLKDIIMAYSTNKLFRSYGFVSGLVDLSMSPLDAPNDLKNRKIEKSRRRAALSMLTIHASEDLDTKTLMWLKENGVPWLGGVMEKASSVGNVEILSQINHKILLEKCQKVLVAASKNGHVNVLEWFAKNVDLSEKMDEDRYFMVDDEAVYGGHLNVLKWSYARNKEFRIYSIDQLVSIHGHVHILEWLLSKGIIGRRSVVPYSGASHGHLGVVKFAHENGFVLSKGIWEVAYMRARWHILDWALEMGNLLFKSEHSKTLSGWCKRDNKVPYVKYI